MTYDATILAESSIKAYYKLNEASGTTASDSTANAFNGTLSGTITLNQAAIAAGLDPCMLFDGTSGQISLPTGVNIAPPFSWEFWMRGNGGTNNPYMLSNNAFAGVGVGWNHSGGDKVHVYGNSGSFDTVNALATSGTTYYVCLTVDTSSNYSVYVGKVGTDSAPSQWGTANPGAGPTYSGSTIIADSSTGSVNFKGYMSSVAVYSAVLTSAQMNSHYTAGITAAGAALSGTLPGVGAISGAAGFSTALTSALSGAGSLSGGLQASTSLSALFPGLGALSATPNLSTYLLTSLDGVGALSGLSTLRTALSSTLPGSGALIGSLQGGGVVLPIKSITHTVLQALSAAWNVLSALGLAVSHAPALTITHQELAMPAPNSTILPTITVTDISGALVSNASSVSLVVYFPDSTSSSYSLTAGITNLGAGQYQAKYDTKQAGEIREVWSIVGADGTTKASAQFLVGVEY